MHHVKLITTYYLDPAVANLSADAECLFIRSIAYCGAAESHGFVPAAVLPGLVRNPTPKRLKAVITELVEGYPDPLWLSEPGGWRLRKWEAIQTELEGLLARRESDVERQRRRRERVRREAAARGQDELPDLYGASRDTHGRFT